MFKAKVTVFFLEDPIPVTMTSATSHQCCDNVPVTLFPIMATFKQGFQH